MDSQGKSFIGCFGFFIAFILLGLVTNLYRSYQAESSRTERLTQTEATVVKWEEKYFNNGEEQFPYAQCTVAFETADGTVVERPLMTIFERPEVDLDETLTIVYDPLNQSFARTVDEPDGWPQTRYYMIASVLCLVLLLIIVGVARSGGTLRA